MHIKIYADRRKKGSTYYRVSYYLGGKRKGKTFAALEDARKEAAVKAAQISSGDVDALQLDGRDRLIYGRALEAIRTLDIALDAADIDYAEAKKLLGHLALQEAARFFLRHNNEGIEGKKVFEAYDSFLQSKQKLSED